MTRLAYLSLWARFAVIRRSGIAEPLLGRARIAELVLGDPEGETLTISAQLPGKCGVVLDKGSPARRG
jgi:hypothetical protein